MALFWHLQIYCIVILCILLVQLCNHQSLLFDALAMIGVLFPGKAGLELEQLLIFLLLALVAS